MTRRRIDIHNQRPAITQRADGKWHAHVPVGRTPGGKLIRKHVKAGSYDEALATVKDLETKRDSGKLARLSGASTLSEWIDRWLLKAALPGGLKPSTITNTRSALRKWVVPEFGAMRLENLDRQTVKQVYLWMADNGASDHVVAGVHRMLRSVLSGAVDAELIAVNPAMRQKIRAPEVDEVEPYDLVEMRLILSAARRRNRNGARWSIALALGLRQGEALGLHWDDIDWSRSELKVRRSLSRRIAVHGCGTEGPTGWPCGARQAARCSSPAQTAGLVEGTPKTKGSRRTVPIPEGLLRELAIHQAAQEAEANAHGYWEKPELVFSTASGWYIDPKADSNDWHALLDEAGVQHKRLHDARHTSATMLLLQGVDERVVMAILGWTERKTAQRYSHIVDKLRHDAAARVDSVLWPVA